MAPSANLSLVWSAVRSGGSLIVRIPRVPPSWCAALGDGEETFVTLTKYARKRSNAQNRRYFALLTCACEDLGWDYDGAVEQMHEEVAYALLKLPDCPRTGMRRRLRTPKLNTEDFGRYMERVEAHLVTECGVDLSRWGHHEQMQEAA